MATVIETATGKELYGTLSNECLPTETLVPEVRTFWCLKPYFDFNTRTFYETATQQEIDEATKPTVAEEVQLWRIRTILKVLGMEQVVEIALNSLQEPQKTGALYIWNYGTTVERNSQTVQLLQSVLGLTSEQVDDIFIQAQNIQL